AGTEDVERTLAEPLVELAPEDLLDRRLGTGHLAVGEIGQHAETVRAQDLGLDDESPELLAHRGALAADLLARAREQPQLAAGAGLAEPLAPDLVAGEHRREKATALRLAAVVDERRTEEADTEGVQDRRRVGARQLGLEDRLFDLGRAPPSPLDRPVDAEIPRLVQLALPRAAQLDQAVLGRVRVAQLLAPRPAHVGLEPCAELVTELQMSLGELEVHRRPRLRSSAGEAPRVM